MSIMDATGNIVKHTVQSGGGWGVGTALSTAGTAASGWLGYGAVTAGTAALTFTASKVWDFGVGQFANYRTANAPKYAWKVGAAAGDALVKGVVGDNIVGQGIGYAVGQVVGGEAANIAAGGGPAEAMGGAIEIAQVAYEKFQETKQVAEEKGPEEALNEAEQSLANKLGIADLDANTVAKKVAKTAAKRYVRNYVTVALVDATKNAAYTGAMTAGRGYLGGLIGSTAASVVSYLPACMASNSAAAYAVTSGYAAIASTGIVYIAVPIAASYAAPYVADAASQAAEGAYEYYNYWMGGQTEATVAEKIQEEKITTVADELEQAPEAGEIHKPELVVEEEDELNQDMIPEIKVEEPAPEKGRVRFRV